MLRTVVETALVGLALLNATSLRAQTTSASVFGSVKDSLGGALPGATVTLLDQMRVAKAIPASATTDDTFARLTAACR